MFPAAGRRLIDGDRACSSSRVRERALARHRARDDPVHRHRRLDRAGVTSSAIALWARARPASPRARPPVSSTSSAAASSTPPATASSPPSTGRSRAIQCARTIARVRARARPRRPCRPAHGRLRAPRRKGVGASPSASARASPRVPGRARCWSRRRCEDLVAGSYLAFDDRGHRRAEGRARRMEALCRRSVRRATRVSGDVSIAYQVVERRPVRRRLGAGMRCRTSSCSGRTRLRAVLQPSRVVLSSDPLRQARHRSVGPRRGNRRPRDADGRRARGDGRSRIGARGGRRASRKAAR